VLVVVRSSQFKRDVKTAQKRGKDLTKLQALPKILIEQRPLPPAYRDHPPKGNWGGYRDAHIEPDWLLIYRISRDELHLARTGTHSDLFNE